MGMGMKRGWRQSGRDDSKKHEAQSRAGLWTKHSLGSMQEAASSWQTLEVATSKERQVDRVKCAFGATAYS